MTQSSIPIRTATLLSHRLADKDTGHVANPEIPEQAFPQIEISESNGSDLYLSEGVPIQDVLAGPVPPNPGITIREATLLETAGVKGIGEAVSIRPPDDVEKSDFDLLHE